MSKNENHERKDKKDVPADPKPTGTKIQCPKCFGNNIRNVTGVTIGDPLKQTYTEVILKECLDCKRNIVLKITIEDGKRKFTVIEPEQDCGTDDAQDDTGKDQK